MHNAHFQTLFNSCSSSLLVLKEKERPDKAPSICRESPPGNRPRKEEGKEKWGRERARCGARVPTDAPDPALSMLDGGSLSQKKKRGGGKKGGKGGEEEKKKDATLLGRRIRGRCANTPEKKGEGRGNSNSDASDCSPFYLQSSPPSEGREERGKKDGPRFSPASFPLLNRKGKGFESAAIQSARSGLVLLSIHGKGGKKKKKKVESRIEMRPRFDTYLPSRPIQKGRGKGPTRVGLPPLKPPSITRGGKREEGRKRGETGHHSSSISPLLPWREKRKKGKRGEKISYSLQGGGRRRKRKEWPRIVVEIETTRTARRLQWPWGPHKEKKRSTKKKSKEKDGGREKGPKGFRWK